MWSRRSILAALGVSVSSLSVAGKLGKRRSEPTNPYLKEVTIETLAGNVDADDKDERLVWVRFVPKRRLVAVRLEASVDDARNVELARSLDSDDDGWYVIARRIRLGHEHRGTEQYIEAPENRQLPDADERWLLRSRGFQPETTNGDDFRGFNTGDVLRVVVVPYGGDPVVITEHVVGAD